MHFQNMYFVSNDLGVIMLSKFTDMILTYDQSLDLSLPIRNKYL